MEFIKQTRFQLNQQPNIANKTSLLSNKVQKRIDKVKITCCKYSPDLQAVACGLSDGSIIQFVNQKFSNQKLTSSKAYQVRKFIGMPKIHKGQIKCILYQTIFQQNLVITGSADRTIKIWDTQPKSKDIVQTLTEHGGTILCLAYSKKSDTLFSGSSDKTIRIWRQDQARKFSLYPWYICFQVISDFCSKKSQLALYPTSFELHDGEMNNFVLYVGDSMGNLHIIKEIQVTNHSYSYMQSNNQNQLDENYAKIKTAFEIDQSNYSYHRLTINQIVEVGKEHLVFTCSFDQNIFGFESLSEKLVLKYSNPRKCIFTAMTWYKSMLIAADQQGVLYCIEINSDRGIQQLKKYNGRILQLITVNELGQIFVVSQQFVDVIKIIRGVKAVEGGNCHSDAIVGMFALQAYRITDKKVKDTSKIITVSIDNSMRVWDPQDLTCIQVLPNTQKSEICSLFYLKRANLFVTGHENGAVRLWNIELQTFITISTKNSPHAHKNNVCCFTEYIYIRGNNNDDITQYMFSAGYQGKVNVWQIFIKKNTAQSSLMSSTICPQLKFSYQPEDQQFSTKQIGSQIFCLQVWQPKNAEFNVQALGQFDDNKSSNPHSSSAYVLSAGSKGIVYFTKVFTYETTEKLRIHQDTINCMIIDQNILFTGSHDKTIKMTSLQNKEMLNVLQLHSAQITHLEMIQQTGHLMSMSSAGQIFFWDYTKAQVAKKIKEKKQTMLSNCYFDEMMMLYVGTEDAKMLSYSLKDLYENSLHRGIIQNSSEISQQSLQKMMRQNQAELEKMQLQ